MDHLLVVDDEKSVRDVLKDALEYYGYKVTIASNGQEGLEYFNNSHNFKLVITDIQMPIMDGIQFARSIRNSTKPDIPIIAITGFFVDKNRERDLFNYIIGKPFDLESLAKVISQLLESSNVAP